MRWTLSKQILAGYAISFLIPIILGLLAFRVSQEMLGAFENRRHASKVLSKGDQILSLMQDAETGQRGFIITGTDRYLDPFNNAVDQLPGALKDLKDLSDGSGNYASDLSELQKAIDEKVSELNRTISLRRSAGFQQAADVVTSDQGKQEMDRIRALLGDLKDETAKNYEESDLHAQAEANNFRLLLFVGIPVSGAIMLLVSVLSARSIAKPVNEVAEAAQRVASGELDISLTKGSPLEEIRTLSNAFVAMVKSLRQSAAVSQRLAEGDLTVEVKPQSDADVSGAAQAGMVSKLSQLIEQVQRSGVQVNSSAVQIAATSKQQQSTAGEMASTTTEIGATAKEMSATSSELLKVADNVNAVSQQLSGLASGGKEGLLRMEQIMRQIMEASSSITARFGEMNDKAGNIGSVVGTITKIADQTNLLSLNAAIEAEKAGEYGRGFSVVASEIRRLADQTAASTLDIERMVKDMVGSVSAGVMGMDKFSEEIRRSVREVTDVSRQIDLMIERVQTLAPSIELVHEGMRSQTQGAGQISEALAQLGEAARQTADAIRDSNRAVEQLNEASRGLQSAIAKFKLR